MPITRPQPRSVEQQIQDSFLHDPRYDMRLSLPQLQPDQTATPIEIHLVTVKQAAEILRCSERKIFRLIENGHLDSVQIGGSRRIDFEEIRRIMKQGTR